MDYPLVEQRRKMRFPISLTVRYSVIGSVRKGIGTTLNVSSEGLLLPASNLHPGDRIKAILEWPVPKGGLGGITLHVEGVVVRAGEGVVAINYRRGTLCTAKTL